jgi:RNA polymerase sigma-70 factor (ECF subfamily)
MRVRGARVDADPLTGDLLSRVRGILVVGGVPWDQLDDAVQSVRLKLLEHDAGADREELRNPVAWVAVVAYRVGLDWHRAQRHEKGLRDRLALRWQSDRAGGPSEEDRVLALAVAAGLDRLPDSQRRILALRFYADLTVQQIAELLDVPEGTVKSRLHAAVTAIGTRLRETEVI